jgi:hypothetical protein
MKILKLSAVIFFFLILSGLTNQIQAQPEFATVRLVTTWSKSSVLFVTIGGGELQQIELKQKYTDRKQTDEYGSDNIIINTEFEMLYTKGFKLVSTSSSDQPGGGFVNPGREVIFLFVKE